MFQLTFSTPPGELLSYPPSFLESSPGGNATFIPHCCIRLEYDSKSEFTSVTVQLRTIRMADFLTYDYSSTQNNGQEMGDLMRRATNLFNDE